MDYIIFQYKEIILKIIFIIQLINKGKKGTKLFFKKRLYKEIYIISKNMLIDVFRKYSKPIDWYQSNYTKIYTYKRAYIEQNYGFGHEQNARRKPCLVGGVKAC
jgi:hypothetical protein